MKRTIEEWIEFYDKELAEMDKKISAMKIQYELLKEMAALKEKAPAVTEAS